MLAPQLLALLLVAMALVLELAVLELEVLVPVELVVLEQHCRMNKNGRGGGHCSNKALQVWSNVDPIVLYARRRSDRGWCWHHSS